MSTSNNSGQGFRPDINWTDTSAFNNQHNRQKEKGVFNKLSLFEYLSHLQTLSVQEKVVTNKLDKDLFTIGQSLNGFTLGFKTGLFMNILIVLYLACFYGFTSQTPRISVLADTFFINVWVVLVIVLTMWLGSYSRYVSGEVTKKMITVLFMGKMTSSIVSGVLILFGVYTLKSILASGEFEEYISYLHLDITAILQHYNQAISMLIFQVVVSSFLALVMLKFRNYFTSGDMKDTYEKY